MVWLPSKYIVHCIQFLMLVLLISVAFYVSVGRILVSISDIYQDDIPKWLEARLDGPVGIGSVEAAILETHPSGNRNISRGFFCIYVQNKPA